MSNKRRKSIGQKKLRRNWLIRVRRGNPTRPPGTSNVYFSERPVDAAYAAHGEKLRQEQLDLVFPYWSAHTESA